jgi:hypothetical protein
MVDETRVLRGDMKRSKTMVEVDQSIKIGNLSVATVLAFSDHICGTVLIPAEIKRILMMQLRERGKSKIRATVQIFAAALFLLLERAIPKVSSVVIDTEYTGYEPDIEGMLLNHLRKVEPEFGSERLVFRQVGKSSSAHKRAIAVHRGQMKPDRVLKVEDFRAILK